MIKQIFLMGAVAALSIGVYIVLDGPTLSDFNSGGPGRNMQEATTSYVNDGAKFNFSEMASKSGPGNQGLQSGSSDDDNDNSISRQKERESSESYAGYSSSFSGVFDEKVDQHEERRLQTACSTQDQCSSLATSSLCETNCVPCEISKDCDLVDGKPVCVEGTCEECMPDSSFTQCSGSNTCMSDYTCAIGCKTQEDCTDKTAGKCTTGTGCSACTTDSECSQFEFHYCSSGTCTQDCVLDSDCTSQYCILGQCFDCDPTHLLATCQTSGDECYSKECKPCDGTDDTGCAGTEQCISSVCQTCDPADDAGCTSQVCGDDFVCYDCTEDADCTSQVCNTGTCVDCNAGGGCAAGEQCQISNNTCIDCVDNDGCTSQVCDTGTCVDCLADSDCAADPASSKCDNKSCTSCDDSSQCTDATLDICSGGNCVDCDATGGCMPSEYCDAGTCATPCTSGGCANNEWCANDGASQCQTCTCTGGTPHCQDGDGCVTCDNSNEATKSPTGCTSEYCIDVGGTLTCKECYSNADCTTAALSECSTSNECIECTTASDCNHISDLDYCLSGTGCVECEGKSDCGATDYCDATGGCTSCGCSAGDSMCEQDQTCHVCDVTDDSGCVSQVCRDDIGNGDAACYDCDTDADCDLANLSDCVSGVCTLCTSTADCSHISASYVCDLTDGCQTCTTLNNEGCSGSETCVTNACYESCTSNGDCTSQYCHTSNRCLTCSCTGSQVCQPDGTCVDCIVSDDCDSQVCLTGSNICVDCNDSNDCDSSVCLTGSNVCVDCNVTSDCAGNAIEQVCNTTSNECVECTSGEASNCTGTTSVCADDMTCVECTDDNDCSGDYCKVSGNTCEECLDSTHCTTAALAKCDSNVCTNCDDDSQCVGIGTSNYCDNTDVALHDVLDHICKPQCSSDSDCTGTSSYCNMAINFCRDCPCAAGQYCEPQGPCVNCLNDGHCSGGTPYCNTSDYDCDECRTNTDCDDTQNSLCASGTCSPCESDSECQRIDGSYECDGDDADETITGHATVLGDCKPLCTQNSDCNENGGEYCNTDIGFCRVCPCTGGQVCKWDGECVDCLNNDLCSPPEPYCETSSLYECQECLTNSNCSVRDDSFCDSGTCQECLQDSHCAHFATGDKCDSANLAGHTDITNKCKPNCSSDATCNIAGGEYCNTDINFCRVCECNGSDPYCLGDATCVECKNNGHCELLNQGTDFCDLTSNTCKACLTDNECQNDAVSGREFCDSLNAGDSWECKPCVQDNNCDPGDADLLDVCDRGDGFVCRECYEDQNCVTTNNPKGDFCRLSDNECVECLDHAGCNQNGDIDQLDYCVSYFCVRCMDDDHCEDATQSQCSNNDCIPCSVDGHCDHIPDGLDYCDLQLGGHCVECYEQDHCMGGDCMMDCFESECEPICRENVDCMPGEYCNAAGVCLDCICEDPEECIPDGTCSECTTDAHCNRNGGDSDNNDVCENTNSYLCVECTADSHCTFDANKPACNTQTNQCETCQSDSNCTGNDQFCVNSQCVECVQSSDCSGDDICAQNTCQPCQNDGQCDGDLVCNTRGECRTCKDNSQCVSNRFTPFCRLGDGECGVCWEDSDCGVGLLCDQSADMCKQCINDDDCDGNQICGSTYTCADCFFDGQCPESQVCRPNTRTCHDCYDDSHCASNEFEKKCNFLTDTCVECRNHEECEGADNLCTQNKCVLIPAVSQSSVDFVQAGILEILGGLGLPNFQTLTLQGSKLPKSAVNYFKNQMDNAVKSFSIVTKEGVRESKLEKKFVQGMRFLIRAAKKHINYFLREQRKAGEDDALYFYLRKADYTLDQLKSTKDVKSVMAELYEDPSAMSEVAGFVITTWVANSNQPSEVFRLFEQIGSTFSFTYQVRSEWDQDFLSIYERKYPQAWTPAE